MTTSTILWQVYGEGSGADCRRHVQKLNMLRAAAEEPTLPPRAQTHEILPPTYEALPPTHETACYKSCLPVETVTQVLSQITFTCY